MAKKKPVNNVIVVSDLHCGCRMGLLAPEGAVLDGGLEVKPSRLQLKVWELWTEFWDVWVPKVTRGEPYVVVINGDSLDGVHHNSTTQVSHDLNDQANIAADILRPVAERAEAFYMIRGTEAHGGPSGVEEERLAKSLGAVRTNYQHATHELWLEVGNCLVHFLHTIGTTGSAAYESSGPQKELINAYAESGQWGRRPPNVVVRSHRHRHIEIRVPTSLGYGIVFVTCGWQLKTPFAYKIAGARQSQPQIGGSLIRQGDEDWFTRHMVWTIDRPTVVKV